jgi:hypothetical protein
VAPISRLECRQSEQERGIRLGLSRLRLSGDLRLPYLQIGSCQGAPLPLFSKPRFQFGKLELILRLSYLVSIYVLCTD